MAVLNTHRGKNGDYIKSVYWYVLVCKFAKKMGELYVNTLTKLLLSSHQTSRLEEVKRQEKELLENQSIPLRNYLMKHVMPTLTQGLIECCKVRPDDAIDYLVSLIPI